MESDRWSCLVQEMHFFDDGSVVARSGPAWIIWEPRDGIERWKPGADPVGRLWKECNAASFIATKGQRSHDGRHEAVSHPTDATGSEGATILRA